VHGFPLQRPYVKESPPGRRQIDGVRAALRPMNSHELRVRLDELALERLEAESAGLTACESYMKDLENEICECRVALVGAAVTEIAVARAEFYGSLQG
jgi:hypothetical protein